jgi:hypothetical protein
MGYFTIENIVSTNNAGHGLVSNIAPALATLTDVIITRSAFSNNGSAGIRTASHSVDGFNLTNSTFTSNSGLGLAFNSSDNATAQIGGVTLNGVTFSGNSTTADLYAFRMLGNMSLTNVDFLGSNGSGLFGLYLLGGYVNQASAPAIGTVILNDVTVSGTYTSAGISFLGYSNLAGVSMADVVLNTTVPTADRGHMRLSGVAGTLDLGNTAFGGTTPLDIRLGSNFGSAGSIATVQVDATDATFNGVLGSAMSLSQLFAVEDRIRHTIDGATDATGLVRVKSGQMFAQTITFTQPIAMTMTTADQALVATSSAGGSYPVSLASTTTSVCTIFNRAVHVVSAGTCSITASQAGDGTYLAANNVTQSFEITKIAQTITFTQPIAMTMTTADQALVATSSAGDSYPVSLASTTTSVCTIVNRAVHVVSAGTCSITASQAGDGVYLPATNVVETLTISKLTQTITFTQPTAMTVTSDPQTLVATSSAGGSYPVVFASTTSSFCTVVNGAIEVVAFGTCSITASQAGDEIYAAAVSATKSIAVASREYAQTITFTQPTAMTVTSDPQTLVATSSAGISYPVTLTSTTSSICTVVNGAIQVVSAGTCFITASQAGDGTYLPAINVVRSIAITKLANAITFTSPVAMTMASNPQTLVATSSAGSSYPVAFASTTSSICTVANGAIQAVATGTCSITASQAGDGTYLAAANVSKSFVITKSAQTITFTQPTAMTMTSSPQTLVATSSAGTSYPVTLTSTTSSICTVVNGAIQVVSAGTCSITASRSGDGNYLPAINVVRSIAITKLANTITFTQPTAMTMTSDPQPLVATTSTGSSVTFTSATSSICTVVNGAIQVVKVGTCSITASQAGNAGTTVASNVIKSITITRSAQTITFTQPNAMTRTSSPQTLVATSSAGRSYPVAFASTTSSVCTVVNGAIRVVRAGTCSITASRAGDGTYSTASKVSRSIVVTNN